MKDFGLFMEIPEELKISQRQKEAINKLDLSNRRAVIKMLMKEQGLLENKKASEDIGYQDYKGKWTGKNDIYSKEDFLNNPQIQEDALDEYLKNKMLI